VTDVRKDLIEIGRMLREVNEGYQWAHRFAYSPTTRGGFGEGGKNTGHSDPTGRVVEDERKEKARELLDELAGDVSEALSRLRKVRSVLRKRFGYGPFDLTALHDPGQETPKVDVAAAREAQARRIARGEGMGDG
jgi:hypothetical protein